MNNKWFVVIVYRRVRANHAVSYLVFYPQEYVVHCNHLSKG